MSDVTTNYGTFIDIVAFFDNFILYLIQTFTDFVFSQYAEFSVSISHVTVGYERFSDLIVFFLEILMFNSIPHMFEMICDDTSYQTFIICVSFLF